MRKLILLSLALSGMLFTACADIKEKKTEEPETVAQADTIPEEMSAEEQENILAVVKSSEDFSTLAAAISAAQLDAPLSGEGPLTVFAPTNEAFQKLGDEALKSLMTPESKEKLHGILTYHVVEGDIDATTLIRAIEESANGYEVTTLNGEALKFTLEEENVVISDSQGNRASVIVTDKKASNGMIHVIDAVLVPNG